MMWPILLCIPLELLLFLNCLKSFFAIQENNYFTSFIGGNECIKNELELSCMLLFLSL